MKPTNYPMKNPRFPWKYEILDWKCEYIGHYDLEIEFNQGVMIIRAQGGVFDFYIMVGDTPSDVIQQYHTMIGKPFMPPYWAYGYQLSKWGYQDLEEVQTVVNRTRALGIPYEMQYIDIGMVNSIFILLSFIIL